MYIFMIYSYDVYKELKTFELILGPNKATASSHLRMTQLKLCCHYLHARVIEYQLGDCCWLFFPDFPP